MSNENPEAKDEKLIPSCLESERHERELYDKFARLKISRECIIDFMKPPQARRHGKPCDSQCNIQTVIDEDPRSGYVGEVVYCLTHGRRID